ncbi:MAG: DNA cytosine methyltransferase [Syntrophomonas sp.]
MRQSVLFRQYIPEGQHELVVDNFAGGGGASEGIEQGLGRPVDIAINHDQDAIAMHKANHPHTVHYCESVWDVDPREVTQGRPVGLVWLSPDCKHFSKAKGGKPVEKHIRSLAWVTLRWAATVRPRVIILENVEEFQTWGPLLENGKPDPKQKSRTFNSFINALRRHGYRVDWRELRACDYGAPTIRKRLFLIARCDGLSIVWPETTHGAPENTLVQDGILQSWHTAAEIIDWSLPCPSIFERARPLADNTMRRIARGIFKFVINNPQPFIMQAYGGNYTGAGSSIYRPLPTITAKDHNFLISPVIARQFGKSIGHEVTDPLGTITAGGGGKSQLVAAFLAKYHGEKYPTEARGQVLDEPIRTLDTSNRFSLVTSHLIKFRGTNTGQAIDTPLHTVTAGGFHLGEVRAFLLKYYGSNIGQACNDPLQTITTKHRFGLVTVAGQDYQIIDIGMRMLEPYELFAAQGFPDSYIIDRDITGRLFSKALQVKMCGNSVSPYVAKALTRANVPDMCRVAA